MWIRSALLLLCYLYEQTTSSNTSITTSNISITTSNISITTSNISISTSSILLHSLTSTTSSTPTPPSTITSTTSPSETTTTFLSTSSTTTSSTTASSTAHMFSTVYEHSSIISNTTDLTSVTSEATTETTRSSITTVTSQNKLSVSATVESLSSTSKNTDNETTTVLLDASTSPKEMSDTSHSYPVTSSDPMDKFYPTPSPNHLGTILPAAIVPVVVCSTVALMAFFYLRHSRRKAADGLDKKVTSKSIDILDFDNVLRDMNANSQLKYSEEFMALAPVGKEYSKDVAGLEANREKNRYTDIKPYDISRVKLSINPEDESDYINASWIPGYFSRRQYIAAQGPMPTTQDDFWRMVWEYNSRIIVMLTKTVENNRIKCCQYWPSDKEVIMYGDIAVSIIDETETDSWITREMNVSMGQQKRLVKQCFFTKWPDMKTPEDSSSIIDFIRMVRSYCPIRGSSPLVVHCSAGVGRTGAFIALDTAMYQIEEEEKVDIFGIVYKMRLNRVSMVQNERQYIFIYETVADLIRNYHEEKKKNSNGQVNFFMGDMPKTDTISNNLIYQNIDTSNSALVINEDVRNLL